jgi:hypothetical protein
MPAIVDAFWRACLYLFRPRVILISLLPLAAGIASVLALAWGFWEPAVHAVRATLEGWSLLEAALKWVDAVSGASFRAVLAPLVVVVLTVPVFVGMALLMVALVVTPVIVRIVAARRFPALECRRGAGFWSSLGWSSACTLAALAMQAASVPLWLVPPVVLVLPPLIWGWLAFRIMSFDALAQHADPVERRALIQRHRWPLLAMGVVCGYLGALPTLLWVSSVTTLIFAPVLVIASVWLYTLVFVFASAWFVHYCLAALQDLREPLPATPTMTAPAGPAALVADPVPALPPPGASDNSPSA